MDRVPDGGWGWAIAFSAMFIQALFGFLIRGFGIIYLRLLERYRASAEATAWVGTSLLICWGITGPFGGLLMKRFTCRSVAMSGCLVLTIGVIFTGFAPSLYVAYFTFGAAGSGLSLAFNSCFLIVNQYFRKKKAIAMGIMTLGTALGMFICPSVLGFCFELFDYAGGMLLFSGVTLQGCVAAALFFPTIKSSHKGSSNLRNHMDKNDNETYTKPDRCIAMAGKANENCDQGLITDVPPKNHTEHGLLRQVFLYMNLFRNPYLFCGVLNSYGLFYAIYTVGSFAPAAGVQNGLTLEDASNLVTANGGFDAAGKILTALAFDIPRVKKFRSHLYGILGILSGISIFLLPSISGNYIPSLIVCSTFGLVNGGFGGQRNTILTDLVKADQVTDALGLAIFFASCGSISSSLVSGIIRETTGVYDAGFYIAGAIILTGSSFLIVTLIVDKPKLPPEIGPRGFSWNAKC